METVRSLWIGAPLTTVELLCLRSFVANGHDFHLYSYEDLGELPDGVTRKDASAIIPRSRVFSSHGGTFAIFADMFRYKLLYEHGGFWVDMDVVCLRPLEFERDHVFASERTKDGSHQLVNCVLKAPRGSQIMELAYRFCAANPIAEQPWGASGTILLTELLAQHQLSDRVVAPEVFCPVDWWDTALFHSSALSDRQLASSHAVHLWNTWWGRNSLDKDRASVNSLYGRLLARYGLGY